MYIITLNVTPIGKPRMTQQDKWKKRPATTKYWNFKDQLVVAAKQANYVPKVPLDLIFHIPMPKSWSKKKRLEMDGNPHLQTPDTDNLMKAFKDALLEEDSHIWDERGRKVWGVEGRIEVIVH